MILVIRVIEKICLEWYGEIDLIKLVIVDFDLVVEIVKENYKVSFVYYVGRYLKIFLDFFC